jgi:hypothetical protein
VPDYSIEVEIVIDNGITGHIATLGGLKLGHGKWLLKSSGEIEQLRAVLMENCPDRLEITEVTNQGELEALKLKWLGAGAATAPPLEDFAARINAGRSRLRE